jgi:6-phosphogluconolactonase
MFKSRSGLLLLALAAAFVPALTAADMFVYFGTHRSGPGIGFSLAHFDTDTGGLTTPKFLIEAQEPAFFVIDRDGRHLYTCNSGDPGQISAYAIDPQTAQLTLLNQAPSGGSDPSYICLDRTGRVAVVANYEGGTIAAFALTPDGRIGAQTALVQHTGHSVDPKRQTHAYAHSIIVDPTNRFVLTADLGLDRLFVYRFDAATGALTPNDPPYATVKPGSGPRHVTFHPNGRWVYLISEMGCTVTAFNWDSATGALTEFQTITTLPADFKGTSTCAEIIVHPNRAVPLCIQPRPRQHRRVRHRRRHRTPDAGRVRALPGQDAAQFHVRSDRKVDHRHQPRQRQRRGVPGRRRHRPADPGGPAGFRALPLLRTPAAGALTVARPRIGARLSGLFPPPAARRAPDAAPETTR